MNYPQPPPVFKNPGLAAVLSFFYMGLGQIYNGQIGKGVAFLVVYTLSWILTIVVIGLLTTPVLWVFGMYDAYKSAEKINRDLAMFEGRGHSAPSPGPVPPGQNEE